MGEGIPVGGSLFGQGNGVSVNRVYAALGRGELGFGENGDPEVEEVGIVDLSARAEGKPVGLIDVKRRSSTSGSERDDWVLKCVGIGDRFGIRDLVKRRHVDPFKPRQAERELRSVISHGI